MQDFIYKLRKLATSKDRYIKASSIQLIKKLHQVEQELEN